MVDLMLRVPARHIEESKARSFVVEAVNFYRVVPFFVV